MFHVFQIFVAGAALLCPRSCDAKVMMEYIGATGVPVKMESVPVQDGVDFHFLLSFAIDSDPLGNPQNGKFSPYWARTLTPKFVTAFKARHPKVKVLASLAGWSINNKEINWYDPKNPDQWITNAFNSLKTLANKYHLDGIDIDYEIFKGVKKFDTFAYCIGELITKMKKQGVISIATIAPFYTTVAPYMVLFYKYGRVVDYVNYQFYTDKVKSPVAYLKTYQTRAAQFGEAKLLPSYEVNGRGIQGDGFFTGLSLLEKYGFAVNGIMIFSADASASNHFYFERKAQAFLLNSTTSN